MCGASALQRPNFKMVLTSKNSPRICIGNMRILQKVFGISDTDVTSALHGISKIPGLPGSCRYARDRTPPHSPVPATITVIKPVGWAWDVMRETRP
ncbi:hypothetical protein AVEN_893-1 [Araneus ventricosus]|uniref:Uncharacterized protein n=1 Tax=Araneus ventricosus TaxID=182803 RepID=A0A4Y2DSD4_ARAVE|nr:hypothetical protein AVEN_893-1 [Araneus ventricosus]